ncbi:Ephrin type-B receptor 1, partial [Geodia barretti]
QPLIVLEILVKGDLKRQLRSLKPKRHGQEVSVNCPGILLSYCRQVAAGMAYLQSRDFVHRDLAARNILISCDDICKIADFGLARHLCNTESHSGSWTGRIPVRWTAPEAIQRREFTSACDVWSFGVMVWEIWSLGSRPYTSHLIHSRYCVRWQKVIEWLPHQVVPPLSTN